MNSRILTRRAFLLSLGAATATCVYTFKVQQQASKDAVRSFALTNESSLGDRANAKGLIYGAASRHAILSSDTNFAVRFVQECTMLVPEWELKWNFLRPSLDRFDFVLGDWLVDFAQQHGLLVRGHTLLWHDALPDWFHTSINRQNAESVLINHIETVVKHYKGKMHSWDVVNEAINVRRFWGQSSGLRNSPWLEFLGENYIDLAFHVAAQADPEALLVYNDYGLEYDTPEDEAKREAVLKLLERLKTQGVPIHAFGMQSHLDGKEARLNPKKLRQFLADVASLGLKILVTELDVTDKKLPADITVRDRIVAAAYEDYLNVVLDEPAVIAVLTWGLSDRYTWLSEFEPRPDGLPVRPLPLDANLNRKLAWNAMARAFDNAPNRTVVRI